MLFLCQGQDCFGSGGYEDLLDLFSLPLSEQAFQEFQDIQLIINETQLTGDNLDVWTYPWGTREYSAKKIL